MAHGAEAVLCGVLPECRPWIGDARGERMRLEAAAFALRGINDFDWALVRWCCGVEDPETRRATWARVMLAGEPAKRRDEAAGLKWPRGRLSGFCATVVEELRPKARDGLSDARRLELIAAHERAAQMPRTGIWCRRWKPRYLAILADARGIEGRVLAELRSQA